MNKDLGFSSGVFGFGTGVFFLGYFLFEVPSNVILDKVGARLWIARVMITWGIVSGVFAFITGESSFYILRFLLGAAEAGFFPGNYPISQLLVSCAPPGAGRFTVHGCGADISRAWLSDIQRIVGVTWPIRTQWLAMDVPAGSCSSCRAGICRSRLHDRPS